MASKTILAGRVMLIAGFCLALGADGPACAHAPLGRVIQSDPLQKEALVTKHASGTFDVKLTPLKAENQEAESANLGKMSIDKQFHGDLEGVSRGEMLSAMSAVEGSAGYVAIERVTGTLQGRSGTFVLQHTGTMTRGVPHLSVTVVPDSGTDGLLGISGAMTIKIEGKAHFYVFEYTLPHSHSA
jgi:hypothetical protein